MSDNLDMEDNYEGSNGTGVLIPQAQIMEVLHNLNVSLTHLEFSHKISFLTIDALDRCGKEFSPTMIWTILKTATACLRQMTSAPTCRMETLCPFDLVLAGTSLANSTRPWWRIAKARIMQLMAPRSILTFQWTNSLSSAGASICSQNRCSCAKGNSKIRSETKNNRMCSTKR